MLRTFAEAAAEYCAGVEKRVGQSLGKMLVLGVLAGAFIAFAGVAASIAGTVGGKLATAAVFPMGLAMVILGGSELFTGNCLFLLPVLGKNAGLRTRLGAGSLCIWQTWSGRLRWRFW